jgi:hypothetical protein
MDPSLAAIEVATARWEQWVGAALRAERFRALTAAARAPRRRARPARRRPRTRRSLLWMLAVSVAGYLLLR